MPENEPPWENGHTPISGAIRLENREKRRKKTPTVRESAKRIAEIVGAIVAAGTIIGVLGRAFYVQREEYTAKLIRDAEAHERIQAAIEKQNAFQERQGAYIEKTATKVESVEKSVNEIRVNISAFGRRLRGGGE